MECQVWSYTFGTDEEVVSCKTGNKHRFIYHYWSIAVVFKDLYLYFLKYHYFQFENGIIACFPC